MDAVAGSRQKDDRVALPTAVPQQTAAEEATDSNTGGRATPQDAFVELDGVSYRQTTGGMKVVRVRSEITEVAVRSESRSPSSVKRPSRDIPF